MSGEQRTGAASNDRRSHAEGTREPELDLLRGVAALMVVGFHFLDRGPRVGVMPASPAEALGSVFAYGYLGVHLFFLISGYVILMTAQRSTPRTFIASRVSRLVPAFWIGAALTTLVAFAIGVAAYQPTLKQFALNLSLVPERIGVVPIDGVYWSLAVEIQFYAWVLLALAAGVLRHVERLILIWLAIALVERVLLPSWTIQLWLCTHWAPLFAAGMLFHQLRHQGGTPLRWALLALAMSMAAVNAWSEAARVTPESRPDLMPAIAAGAVVVFFVLFLAIQVGWFRLRPRAWITLAAALSYPLYVVHQNIGYMLSTRLGEIGVGATLGLVLTFAGVLALSWLINRWIERPLARPLRRAVERLANVTSGRVLRT